MIILNTATDKKSLYRALDRRSIKSLSLFKDSVSLYFKNFFNLIQLFILSSLLVILVFVADFLIPETSLIIVNEVSYQEHDRLLFFKHAFFTISILIFIIGNIFIALATIKIIDKKPKNLLTTFKHIFKKLHSIIFSIIITLSVITIIISVIIYIISFLRSYYNVDALLIAKILLSLLLIPIILLLIDILLRISFFLFVIVIEEKYGYHPLIHSLAYTKNYVLVLVKKLAFMIIVCTILSVISFNIIYAFLASLNVDLYHSSIIFLSTIGLIFPMQLFIISYYLIYNIYSKDFPKTIHISSVQKVKLRVAIFFVMAIAIMMFFKMGVNIEKPDFLVTHKDDIIIQIHDNQTNIR